MFKSLFNVLFPKVCLGCDGFLLANEKVLCTNCRHEIPMTPHFLTRENELTKKFYGRIDLEFGAALLYFHKKGIVQQLIHNLKYRRHQEVGTFLGEWVAKELQQKNIPVFDAVIPVPLHPAKLKKRGFNQVETFGKTVAEQLNCRYDDSVLHRNFNSKTQTFKNLFGRTDLRRDLFGIHNYENISDQHFLLVDDVLTTGATIEACAKELLKIPGTKLSVLTMAFSQA